MRDSGPRGRPRRPNSGSPSFGVKRSEERRRGKECRSRWSPNHYKKEIRHIREDAPPAARAKLSLLAADHERDGTLQADPELLVGVAMARDVRARAEFFFSSRRRHTSSLCDWSSDVCSSD